jgi:hypothetical protein
MPAQVTESQVFSLGGSPLKANREILRQELEGARQTL